MIKTCNTNQLGIDELVSRWYLGKLAYNMEKIKHAFIISYTKVYSK